MRWLAPQNLVVAALRLGAVPALATRNAEVHQQIGMRGRTLQCVLVRSDGGGRFTAQREEVAQMERRRGIRGVLRPETRNQN